MIQINRTGIFSLFAATLLLLQSNAALAQFEIRGKVGSDGSVNWTTVTQVSAGSSKVLAPSQWQTPPVIRAVNSWVPATFAAAPATTFKVRGGQDNQTSKDISISDWGMQYNTGGTTYASSNVSIGTACSVDSVTASSAEMTLKGSSSVCVSKTKLTSATSTNPFLFYRPVFNIVESTIDTALEGLKPGVYTGSIPIIVRYYYYSGSILTYRDINETLLVMLEYVSDEVSEVLMCGVNNVLTMKANYVTGSAPSVNSTTDCQIKVKGSFSNGVNMSMPTDKYELVLTDNSKPSSKIPYSIECNSGCSVSQLVDKTGTLQLPTTKPTTKVSGTGATVIDISLTFKYDIDFRDASNNQQIFDGTYQDTITLSFEPAL